MRAYLFACLCVSLLALGLFSCKKETEQIDGYAYQKERLTELLPLQIGKYITYRLDSTVFPNFGRSIEIHSYQEKNVVDALLTDNLGRPSYRIFRFLRDTAGAEGWIAAGSYFITPTDKTVEVIEDNLREIKLNVPVRQNYSWKGNRYLGPDPYGSFYSFSNDDSMVDWDYAFTDTAGSLKLNGQTINNVVTVSQANESINVPITSPSAFASISYSEEKYAKGIGLVYQELTLWEYQPNTSGPSPYYTGFGIKRSMIDHN
jgi:hypothetical protein